MNVVTTEFQGIGASPKRKEDARFLAGRGNYTDDMNRPGQLHVVFKRSDRPHAKILGYDLAAAKAAPGVRAIYTGEDVAASGIGGVPCGWLIHNKDGSPMNEPPHPILAIGKVRYVGDAIAMVIAETRQEALNAAELLVVDFEDLPPVTFSTDAIRDGAALVHDTTPGNVCYDWHIGDGAAVDAAFAVATHKVGFDLVNNRLVPNAMETRCAIGDCDPSSGDYTLYTTSQNPHVIRLLMGAFVLQIPESKLRVYAPDVGGGFGSKIFHYVEEACVTWAAGKLKRPVKWTSGRTEAFLTDAHGRDHVSHAEMALDADGQFLALRVKTLANMGAYLSTFATSVPTYLYATLLAGCYATPAVYAEVKAVFTNTVPVDAYRGAGRPEATYLVERLVDICAKETGIDRVELRRKNFIPTDAFPYQTPIALQYDSGNYFATLEHAQRLFDWDGFETRRAEAATRGMLRGAGISTYVEACGIAPSAVAGAIGARAGLFEVGTIRVHPTGSITLLTGTHSHGQGHETTLAQLVCDKLGVPLDLVDVVHGDTAKIPFGMGTYGSRSLPVGGSAIDRALDKIIAKGKKIAAHLMEASADDIEFFNGQFRVAGTDKVKALAEISLAAYVPHNYPITELEPGLDETAFYDPMNFTYPAGCHLCEVEIDPQTGTVEVVNFVAVDDVGRVINPMIVEGQVQGGVAQGIGQALMENAAYAPDGQLMSASFMDYTMPRAYDLPNITSRNEVTLCTHNPLGVKGCGETGAIGSPPAVVNAVVDALRDYGVRHIDMPVTAQKVWSVINAAQPRMAAE